MIIPWSWYSIFQTVATATSETIVGRKKVVRNSARRRTDWLSRTADASPRTGPIAIPMTTKKTVFWMIRRNRGSVSRSM